MIEFLGTANHILLLNALNELHPLPTIIDFAMLDSATGDLVVDHLIQDFKDFHSPLMVYEVAPLIVHLRT
jgi:hypothetical protein